MVLRLIKNVPLLKKGRLFLFEIDTGMVWGMKDKNTTFSYPLREELAGYLWLLRTEKGYLRRVKEITK